MYLLQSANRVLAPLLTASLVITTLPPNILGASSPPPEAAIVGSLKAAGTVELRGMAISHEGTLFSGDTIRTRKDSYASVALTSGQQIELGSDTDVQIDTEDGTVTRVAMKSGELAFSSPASSRPLNIEVEPYQIVATQGSVGDVMFLGEQQLGLRAVSGTLTLRSPWNGEPIVIPEGEARVIALGNALALAAPPVSPLTAEPAEAQLGLRIVVVSGNNSEFLIDTAAVQPFTVVVVDRDNLLIPGATVEFAAPQTGASGEFQDGSSTFETVTDETGQAVAGQYLANSIENRYGIQVTAEFQGEIASTIIPVRNIGPGGLNVPLILGLAGGGTAAAVAASRQSSSASRSNP